MTYQPVAPLSGMAGLLFLERTRETQQTAFNESVSVSRDVEYFKENIASVTSAEELVGDYRLLRVALGAFGLDDEIDKKFFIQKVLAEGTDDPESFANSLVDPKYAEISEAFGFGNFLGPNVGQSDFAEKITSEYQTRQFEVAIGNVDNSLRLVMNLKREISDYTGDTTSDATPWYQVMGNAPLREVFETAFGLPQEIGALDVDQQLKIFQDKAEQLFGERGMSVFQDPEKLDELIRLYLSREQLKAGPSTTTPGYGALSLLQAGQIGGTSSANLLLSNS